MWRDPIGRNCATQRVTWISATTDQSEWDQVWVISFLSPLRHHAHSTTGRERFPFFNLGKEERKKKEHGKKRVATSVQLATKKKKKRSMVDYGEAKLDEGISDSIVQERMLFTHEAARHGLSYS